MASVPTKAPDEGVGADGAVDGVGAAARSSEQEEGSVAAIADDLGDAPESEAAAAVADLDQPATRHIEISSARRGAGRGAAARTRWPA